MQSGKWGTKGYLESLHRTYNIPLPRRDDGSFERALQFRAEEKDFYGRLQQENDQLRHRVTKLETTLTTLEKHSNTLLEYYNDSNTSSKSKTNGSHQPTPSSTHGSGSHVERRSDISAAGADSGKGRSKGGSDEVPGEVLPTSVPDSGGQSEGHPDDGPKPGEGDESGGSDAVAV